jgi:hypothetical protein
MEYFIIVVGESQWVKMESENVSGVKADQEEDSDEVPSSSSDVEVIEEIRCKTKKTVDSIGMCSDFGIM